MDMCVGHSWMGLESVFVILVLENITPSAMVFQ